MNDKHRNTTADGRGPGDLRLPKPPGRALYSERFVWALRPAAMMHRAKARNGTSIRTSATCRVPARSLSSSAR